MKRRVVVAASATLVLALAGCTASSQNDGGVAQDSGKPDTLTMLVTASPSEAGLESLAAEYKDQTGIDVQFVEVPTAQLATKIILAAQSKQSTFDLAMVDGFTLPQVVAAGGLASLDSYLADDEDYDYPADFPQGLQDYAKQDGVSYSVPLSTEPYLQWYRTDLYDANGLSPATTWDDAISNAEAIQATGAYGYMPLYNATGSAHFFNEMLVSSGGRMLDPDSYEPLLDSDLAKKTMEQYLSLSKFAPSSAATASSADAVTAFTQLSIGQMILASGWWSTITNPDSSAVVGKVATAQTPLSDEGDYEPASSLYGWLAGVSAVSPHQAAAWDFLSWALGKDNVQAFIDAGAPPPARLSTTSNADYLQQLPYLAAVGDAVQTGVSMPRIPEMPQIVTTVSQTISAMASGQLTVDKGMAKMQDDVLNILVQSGRYKG